MSVSYQKKIVSKKSKKSVSYQKKGGCGPARPSSSFGMTTTQDIRDLFAHSAHFMSSLSLIVTLMYIFPKRS